MKNTKFVSGILAVVAIAFLTTMGSCKKDDDDDNNGGSGTSVSKAGLLTSGGWIATSFEVTFPAPIGTIDQYAMMDACEKDDILYFNSDKTILDDEGATKCDPSDPQSMSGGTWELTDNDTKLAINDDGDIFDLDIISLTADVMSIEITEYDSSLMSDIVIKMSYRH